MIQTRDFPTILKKVADAVNGELDVVDVVKHGWWSFVVLVGGVQKTWASTYACMRGFLST